MKANFTTVDDFFSQMETKMDCLVRDLDLIKSHIIKDLKAGTLYTPKEAAKILKCCDRTVYDYLSKGTLKSIRMGRKLYINSEILQEFLTKGTGGL